MKATVLESCIGCGLCAGTCPEVFSMEGVVAVAAAGTVPPEAEAGAVQACEGCPVDAINLKTGA